MKVALYARVSTDEQTEQNQIPILEKWAAQRGFEVYDIYRDVGSAWQKSDQKELRRLIEDARKGRFSIVMVWALDRLSRGGIGKMFTILDKLGDYRVRVLSQQEEWTDVHGDLQPLLFSVFAWIAEQESKRISERTKAGMERARAAGKHVGRPKKERITVDPEDHKAQQKLAALQRRVETLNRQMKEIATGKKVLVEDLTE